MAYLHCHNCDWSQDDFYSNGYNPAKYLMDWNDSLFGDRFDKLDKQFTDDSEFLRENGPITTREVIAREYEHFAKKIREMKWVTYESFQKDKKLGLAKCPGCGCSNKFDID